MAKHVRRLRPEPLAEVGRGEHRRRAGDVDEPARQVHDRTEEIAFPRERRPARPDRPALRGWRALAVRLDQAEADLGGRHRVLGGEHHLVADHLHDAAAAVEDALIGERLEAIDHGCQLGHVEPLARRREADDVRETDGRGACGRRWRPDVRAAPKERGDQMAAPDVREQPLEGGRERLDQMDDLVEPGRGRLEALDHGGHLSLGETRKGLAGDPRQLQRDGALGASLTEDRARGAEHRHVGPGEDAMIVRNRREAERLPESARDLTVDLRLARDVHGGELGLAEQRPYDLGPGGGLGHGAGQHSAERSRSRGSGRGTGRGLYQRATNPGDEEGQKPERQQGDDDPLEGAEREPVPHGRPRTIIKRFPLRPPARTTRTSTHREPDGPRERLRGAG